MRIYSCRNLTVWSEENAGRLWKLLSFGFALLFVFVFVLFLFVHRLVFYGLWAGRSREGGGGEVVERWRRFAMPTGGPSAHICTTLKTSTPRSTFLQHQCWRQTQYFNKSFQSFGKSFRAFSKYFQSFDKSFQFSDKYFQSTDKYIQSFDHFFPSIFWQIFSIHWQIFSIFWQIWTK